MPIKKDHYPYTMLPPCNKPAIYAYTWPWHYKKTKRSKTKVIRTATRYACQEHMYSVFNTCLLIASPDSELEEYLGVIILKGGDIDPKDFEFGWPMCTNCNMPMDSDPRDL